MKLDDVFPNAAAVCACLFLLSACMSVPPSSYGKLVRLSPLETDPKDIRVAVLAPEDLMMRPGDAVLDVYFKPMAAKSWRRNMPWRY